jgi:hypothetical protein
MDARVSMWTYKVLKNCLCTIRKRRVELRVLPEVGTVLMSMHARTSVAETVFQGLSRLRARPRFLRSARRLTHPNKNVNGIPNVFQGGHGHARGDYRRCKDFCSFGRRGMRSTHVSLPVTVRNRVNCRPFVGRSFPGEHEASSRKAHALGKASLDPGIAAESRAIFHAQ